MQKLYKKEIEKLMQQFESFGIIEHSLPNAIGMWPNEQECLLWLLLNSNTKHNWLEIGAFCGGSAVLMCLAHRFLKAEGKVISVDIDYNPMFDLNVYNRGKFNDIHEKLTINSSNINKSHVGKISFAFIDGFHSFQQVINDFNSIQPFLTDNTIILFHDISPHLYNKEYFEDLSNNINQHYERLFNSNIEDFRLDEAIVFICKNHNFKLIDIPVKTNETHFQETRLNKWVRGTTSPFNSLGAIKKCE